MIISTGDQSETIEVPKQAENCPEVRRNNPRLVFVNPESFFGRDQYNDLLMEQQEQM